MRSTHLAPRGPLCCVGDETPDRRHACYGRPPAPDPAQRPRENPPRASSSATTGECHGRAFRLTESLTAVVVGGWKTGPVTTGTQQTNSRRWLLPFLAALVAALAAILFGTTASASAAVGAETRVGAFNVVGEVPVGPPENITAGQRLGNCVAGPDFVVATGVAAEGAGDGAETFYRTMSKEHFAELQSTGRVPATSETFISPSAEFSSAYEGQMVEFSVRPGTTSSLAEVGVRDASAATRATFPNMPGVSSGWTSSSAFFKGEGGVINIGLGRGTALDIFNDAILGFRGVG